LRVADHIAEKELRTAPTVAQVTPVARSL